MANYEIMGVLDEWYKLAPNFTDYPRRFEFREAETLWENQVCVREMYQLIKQQQTEIGRQNEALKKVRKNTKYILAQAKQHEKTLRALS